MRLPWQSEWDGHKKPSIIDPPAADIDGAKVWDAMRAYMQLKLQVEAAESAGKATKDWLFPSEEDKYRRDNQRLDRMLKKRQLGLPDSDADYEYMVNKEKPFINTGEAITMGTTLLRNPKARLLNLSPMGLFKRASHGSGTIAKLFGI